MNESNSQRLQYSTESGRKNNDKMDSFRWSQSYSNRVKHQDVLKTISAWVEAPKESETQAPHKRKKTLLNWIITQKRERRTALFIAIGCITLLFIISLVLVLVFALSKFHILIDLNYY